MQIAAANDVQQLHPAADGEHRQRSLERGSHQRQLRIVAVAVEADRLGVGRLAVHLGIDVRAAGEHDPVEHVQHLLDALHRWDHHR